MEKIDTHLHLLYPDTFKYSWTASIPPLQGAFTTDDYRELQEVCEIKSAVFMEVDVDPGLEIDEANFFIENAKQPGTPIEGVIAKIDPSNTSFQEQVEAINCEQLKGIRRVLHVAPDEVSTSPTFRNNIALLSKYDLSFDLCVRQDQLQLALELVQACPDTRFILDHCGNPDVSPHLAGDTESRNMWSSGIQALAGHPNINLKFSALGTFANEEERNPKALNSHFNTLLETFGPQRMIWGSDWPVCNLGSGLKAWSDLAEALTQDLSEDEQADIFSRNAMKTYQL